MEIPRVDDSPVLPQQDVTVIGQPSSGLTKRFMFGGITGEFMECLLAPGIGFEDIHDPALECTIRCTNLATTTGGRTVADFGPAAGPLLSP